MVRKIGRTEEERILDAMTIDTSKSETGSLKSMRYGYGFGQGEEGIKVTVMAEKTGPVCSSTWKFRCGKLLERKA